MAYLNLLGYYEKDKDIILHSLLNSSIQNSVHTKHTFGTLKVITEMRNNKLDDLYILKNPNNLFLLKDRYGEYTESLKSLLFFESYFEKGFIFKKTYFVFIDSNQS